MRTLENIKDPTMNKDEAISTTETTKTSLSNYRSEQDSTLEKTEKIN